MLMSGKQGDEGQLFALYAKLKLGLTGPDIQKEDGKTALQAREPKFDPQNPQKRPSELVCMSITLTLSSGG